MLAEQEAWDTFQSLPPEEKREVVDFIARLKTRHAKQEAPIQTITPDPASSDGDDTHPTASHDAVQAVPESQRQPVSPLGAMKGLVIQMADDFDEPLEDFAEYMV